MTDPEQYYFSEKFMASGGKPIQYNGRTVQMSTQLPAAPGQRFRVRFAQIKSKIVQGIAIGGRPKGSLEYDGQQLKPGQTFIFWSDTSPHELDVIAGKGTESLAIWSRSDRDRQTPWSVSGFGQAMIVEPLPDGVRCLVNDCEPDDDFDDMIFTVTRIP